MARLKPAGKGTIWEKDRAPAIKQYSSWIVVHIPRQEHGALSKDLDPERVERGFVMAGHVVKERIDQLRGQLRCDW